MDRLIYLNEILMKKFKDSIQIEDNVEMSENENLEVSQKATDNHDLNDETNKEITSASEIQRLIVSENDSALISNLIFILTDAVL